LWFGYDYYTQPVSEVVSEQIIITEEPMQDSEINIGSVDLGFDEKEVVLTPVAKYDISAEVVGRKNYYTGFDSEFEPTDLALAWGKLVDDNYNQDIKYSQSGRWYHFRYGPNAKLPDQYIADHSANVHIIPGSNNIKQAVRRIKKGQLVHIEGYLINVNAKDKGQDWKQRTSIVRTDSGAGACEIMYVQKIQIDDKIYE